MELVFWIGAIGCVYSYFLYPIILLALSPLSRSTSISNRKISPRNISVIITAFNEEARIREKLENTLRVNRQDLNVQIIVASDGMPVAPVTLKEPWPVVIEIAVHECYECIRKRELQSARRLCFLCWKSQLITAIETDKIVADADGGKVADSYWAGNQECNLQAIPEPGTLVEG